MSEQKRQRIGQRVDVAAVREKARTDWEASTQARLSVQEKIGGSVPWWLVIIGATLFALSVPHTMSVFAQITPYFGYVAPFGIEFGLLYYAFRSRQERERKRAGHGDVPWSLHALGALMFGTAIIVNGAGSLQAVVSIYESTQNMSFAELIEQFPNLPATSQVALLLVPVAALVIPLGTMVAGEGLAKLFLERDEQHDLLSERWERVRASVEFDALLAEALWAGATASQATKWARTIVGLDERTASAMSARTAPDSETDSAHGAQEGDYGQSHGHGHGQGYSRTMDARERVWTYLADNPEDAELSVRALADKVGDVGKTIAHEVREEWKTSRNGHGQSGG